jgi:hypothetical protein
MVSVSEERWVFVRRYLWRLALFALGALGFAWIATHAQKITYRAETELAFKSTESPLKLNLLDLLENQIPLFLEDEIFYVTYDMPSVLSSETLARRVLERNNLKERLYDPEKDGNYEVWFEDFREHLGFDIHEETNSVTIACTAKTPELATEITQVFADEFERYFSTLYWKLSTADAIQKVVDRHTEELAQVNVAINEILAGEKRVAAKRSVAQDVRDYLIAERARIISRARALGYERALERVEEELALARSGEGFIMPREALGDYVLAFLKGVYYQESLVLAELETDFASDHPEVEFWRRAMAVTHKLIERASGGAVQITYNSLKMRAVEAKARYEVCSERADALREKVASLPGFETDVTWYLRMKKYLELAVLFWGKRLEMQRMGEEFADDPFIVIDGPIVPESPYYPILDVWAYAFPVLLIVGSMVFLLRWKAEEECKADIRSGRLR